MNKSPSIVFFGTSDFSVHVLSILKENNFTPALIITASDKPVGRKGTITPPPVKIWAQKYDIPILQPSTLKGDFTEELRNLGREKGWDLFIVASYGKIIPSSVLLIPRHETLNVHPSLLPKLRGASPIETAIIKEAETGVTIMKVDEEMDHGDIVAQEKLDMEWPQEIKTASLALARLGGEMLAQTIPAWLSDKIKGTPQEHTGATYTKKITTQDGEIQLEDNPLENWKKFLAYHTEPGIFFFTMRNGKKIRVRVTDAQFIEGQFIIKQIIPEGKKEMSYADFRRGE